jgi:hypothetical protein
MFVVWKIVQGIDRTTVKMCNLIPTGLQLLLHSRVVRCDMAMDKSATNMLLKLNDKVLSDTDRHFEIVLVHHLWDHITIRRQGLGQVHRPLTL